MQKIKYAVVTPEFELSCRCAGNMMMDAMDASMANIDERYAEVPFQVIISAIAAFIAVEVARRCDGSINLYENSRQQVSELVGMQFDEVIANGAVESLKGK